ncbi:hypothetical protein GCM10027403_38010 [Arthrobacter tecti]
MRNVRHEVVADLFGSGDLRAVIGQDQDVFLAQCRNPCLHNDGALAERPSRQLELPFLDNAVAADTGRQFEKLAVNNRMAPNQAEGICGRTCTDYAVDRVDDEVGAPDDGQDVGGAFRQDRLIRVHAGSPLRFTEPMGQHPGNADGEADKSGDEAQQNGIHKN